MTFDLVYIFYFMVRTHYTQWCLSGNPENSFVVRVSGRGYNDNNNNIISPDP